MDRKGNGEMMPFLNHHVMTSLDAVRTAPCVSSPIPLERTHLQNGRAGVPSLLLLPRDLPVGERRPGAPDLHVDAVGHPRCEGTLHCGADFVGALDGFAIAAEG